MSPQASLQVSPQVAKTAFSDCFGLDIFPMAFIAVYSLDMTHKYGLHRLCYASKSGNSLPIHEPNRTDLRYLYFNKIR